MATPKGGPPKKPLGKLRDLLKFRSSERVLTSMSLPRLSSQQQGTRTSGFPQMGIEFHQELYQKKGGNKVLSAGRTQYLTPVFPRGCTPCRSVGARWWVQVPGDSSSAWSCQQCVSWGVFIFSQGSGAGFFWTPPSPSTHQALENETSVKHAGGWSSGPLWPDEGAVSSQQGRLWDLSCCFFPL